MRILEDVSVTGFDDLPAACYVVPQLITVAQPIRAIGRQDIAKLLALIAGTASSSLLPETALELRLVLRGTTQAPTGSAPSR